MRFQDIPQFPQSNYMVDVPWKSLENTLALLGEGTVLELNPVFQRGHVWTEAQQVAWLEYQLRGGPSGKDIYFNCPTWQGRERKQAPVVLVDGLQRITALQRFLRDELRVFCHVFSEYTDNLRMTQHTLKFHVASLATEAEVLRWYLGFNAGGTPHTPAEITRVQALLDVAEAKK